MTNNIIEILLKETGNVLAPITTLNSPEKVIEFIKELGLDMPGLEDQNFDLSGLVCFVEDFIEDLHKLSQAQNDDERFDAIIELAGDLSTGIKIIEEASETIVNILNKISGSVESVINSADEFFRRLVDYLLYMYMQNYHNKAFSFLLLLGITETKTILPDKEIKTIEWEQFSRWFTSPMAALDRIYNWSMGLDSEKLMDRMKYALTAYNLPGDFYEPTPDIRKYFNYEFGEELRIPILIRSIDEEFFFELDLNLIPLIEDGDLKAGIALYPYFFGEINIEQELAENWILEIGGSIEPKNAGLCLKLRPPHDLELITELFEQNPADTLNMMFEVGIKRSSPTDSMTYIFGKESGSHLALKEAGVKFKATTQQVTPEFSAVLTIKDLTLAINPGGDGDGFIQKLLSGLSIKSINDLAIGVSNVQGIFFEGSSALEIKIPTHIELGPLNIDSAKIGVGLDASDFNVILASDFSVKLGPLFAGVEDIGLTIPLSFPGNGGNLGPVQISSPKFKPPKGVALSIDAEVVKGGGYLFIDADRGEYAGVMELTFQDFLSLKAIGLINTIMPDGSSGFSMLIIITAEFTVQIGMGFVFMGAGGLLGLHRTVKLQPLAEGVRSGATANILFPENVVENATQIISDIKTFFPIQQNYFLIGPMIKLGYGQPALITLSLGVIIEINTNDGGELEKFAILGVLKCILPEEEAPIIVLQVNFIGAVDFRKKTGFFFASIFESRVLSITIEGEMGLLVAWGSDSNFVVSVGGFHPRFVPPPLPFPVPKRVSLSILNKSWGRVRVEGYFAVTTNTVQFGAGIEVMFGMDDFKIEGHLGFDVLFQFNPFFFIVLISGQVSLKVFGAGLFSITARFMLEGPTPWRAKGYGKVKILFITFKARFDKRWGSSKNTKLPPIEVLPILEREFSNDHNWEAVPPSSRKIMVSVREIPKEEGLLVLHPVGKIKVSQRAVPLGIKIDKVGNQKPSDANYFELYMAPAAPVKFEGDIKESFPPGHYFNMKTSKKLSEKATLKYIGGQYLIQNTEEVQIPGVVVRHVRYELTTIDEGYKRAQEACYQSLQLLFTIFLRNNAAARSPRSNRRQRMAKPFNSKINVFEGNYTVANIMTNQPFNADATGFETPWEAESFMASHPEAAGQLHVIPTNEANF